MEDNGGDQRPGIPEPRRPMRLSRHGSILLDARHATCSTCGGSGVELVAIAAAVVPGQSPRRADPGE